MTQDGEGVGPKSTIDQETLEQASRILTSIEYSPSMDQRLLQLNSLSKDRGIDYNNLINALSTI
jgi:hypothetical protein